MSTDATETTKSELAEGLAHLAAERWPEAVASLRRAVRREPGRLGAVRALATALLMSGDADAARRAVRAFTTDQPMCAEGWRLAAQLEWKLARRPEALAVLARGLDHLPNSAVLHRQVALLTGAQGRHAESASHAGRASGEASRIDPWIAATAGRPGDPAEIFQPARPAAPAEPDYFDRVIQEPKLLEGLINLPAGADGAAGGAELNMLRAIEFRLARLVESQPHHADRHLLLARLQHRTGAIPAATLSVQRAIRANPDLAQAHRLHATLLAAAGDPDAAIAILEGLVRRGIHWPDLHVQLAELHDRRGRADVSASHLTSALRLNPDFGQARQMLERRAA